ncbi:hypothetical protein BDB00DRAFT_875555 [Zychaea mexicana]|uniref:uncharacterized protein n=1 Tax=Zychaea mexicana TaxID=64656 RepID=UPI0022FF3CE4|nr:uncharacterized protein BDB00DRAFT_875555 [Zychaea mexicana]KAI9490237.1 hypothetical protein BDB00DRAFT_875555 [Zychaea mexicana]
MEATDASQQQQQQQQQAQPALDTLPPSAKLALLHAQQANDNAPDASEPAVPSAEDPVVVDNAAFAEPIIAGDVPMPIGHQSQQKKKDSKRNNGKLDLASESAFPSLSSSGSNNRPPALSAWSSSSGASRVKASQPMNRTGSSPRASPKANHNHSSNSTATPITDMLELPASQQIANMPSKPLGFKSSADVIQQVMFKTGTNIIASTNRSGTTTFLIQGLPTDVAKAKRELVAGLVVKRTVEIAVPAATRRFIIGTKGKNLQQIESKSGVRINFPPRSKEEEDVELDEDEKVNVTLVGDAAGIAIAKAEIDKIVGEKTAKQTIKIDDIDSKYYLLLAGPRNNAVNALEQEYDVKIQMPPLVGEEAGAPIVVSGDKEKAQAAKQALADRYAQLQNECRTAAIDVPKRQHKYLAGKDGVTLMEILEESGCTIELPALDDPSGNITIRGPDERLIEGLTLAMTKARAVHVNMLDLGDMHKNAANPLQHGKTMLKYLRSRGKFSKIESEYNVQVGLPTTFVGLSQSVPVEFVSKEEKDAFEAYKAGYEACRALTPELFATVDIEPHLHRHIAVRHARQLQRIKSRHSVEIFIPDEKEEGGEIATIALVFEGKEAEGASAALEATISEIKKIAADSSDFVSKTLAIPSEFHRYISGPNGTTLNAIAGGADSAVTVRLGSASDANAVIVRGPADEVNKTIAEINKVYEAAKHEEFVSSYTTDFTIPAAYSAHVIGKAGGNINKLKEELGIKIDISDASANGEADFKTSSSKKNKHLQQKVNVVIQGIQTNVEAAKARILVLVEELADQVTLNLNVPREFHRYLIGPNGRYVRKLEDKYNVYVKFPKSANGTASPSDENTITIRGRKKDASSAKEELQELYEYENDEQNKRKEREAAHEQRKKQQEQQKQQKQQAAAAATAEAEADAQSS